MSVAILRAEKDRVILQLVHEQDGKGDIGKQTFPQDVQNKAKIKTEELRATSSASKKKEISWEDQDYLGKVHIKDMGVRSQVWLLEGKASIGPCFRELAPNVGPSGILICVPKKCSKYLKADCNPIPSVLNINVSKKYVTKSKCQINDPDKATKTSMESGDGLKTEHDLPCTSFFGGVRLKLESFTSKIMHRFH